MIHFLWLRANERTNHMQVPGSSGPITFKANISIRYFIIQIINEFSLYLINGNQRAAVCMWRLFFTKLPIYVIRYEHLACSTTLCDNVSYIYVIKPLPSKVQKKISSCTIYAIISYDIWMNKMDLQEIRILVAIDFGTTHSSFAYVCKENPETIVIYSSW